MKHASLWVVVPWVVLSSCSNEATDTSLPSGGGNAGSTDHGGTGGSAGGSAAPACVGNALKANAANNYAFSDTLTFPAVEVAAKRELTLDWAAVSRDFKGHALDPRQDLKTILVFLWKLPLSELEKRTNSDTLLMRDLVTLPLQFSPQGTDTRANLFQFTNTGEPTQEQILSFLDPDVYPKERYTYTLMATSGETLGEDPRMIQAFTLAKDKQDTTVALTSDSTKLVWEAHLQQAKVTGIPAGEKNITLDWGDMTTNAMGNPFDPTDAITKVLVGHYNESVAELEAKFLDIELIATELYRGVIETGTRMDFATLKTEDGTSFAGIDDKGTWLVGLQCGGCRNPAPWYLSVLKPCQ